MTRRGHDAVSPYSDDEREGRQHDNPFHGAISFSVECLNLVYHAQGTGPSGPHRELLGLHRETDDSDPVTSQRVKLETEDGRF